MKKELEDMTVSELRAYAREIGASTITKLNRKVELVQAIRRYEEKLRSRNHG